MEHDDVVPSSPTPLVKHILVEELFGEHTYDLEVPKSAEGPTRLMVLHGDNGSGKTTILRLLWNLLSPADHRGHRTYLARTPFRRFSVTLADGSQLSVYKADDLRGSFDIAVRPVDRDEFVAHFEVDKNLRIRSLVDPDIVAATLQAYEEERGSYRQVERGRQSKFAAEELKRRDYTGYLEEAKTNPLLLADDRRLYSDDEELIRLREVYRGRDERQESDRDTTSRELIVTLRRVNDWLRRLTLKGQNVGSAEANSIYHRVLTQLAGTLSPSEDLTSNGDEARQASAILRALEQIQTRSPQFEEFGLVPPFAADDFIQAFSAIEDPDRHQVATNILGPYLDSVLSRYRALQDAEVSVRDLVTAFNSFLVGKRAKYSPQDGLSILTDQGFALRPDALSSGERQLMTLLCTTVLAGRDSRLFIIDEPELSLGIDWQRQILESLLTLTSGTGLQFIVATHSIEIMSSQPEELVRLERR